MTGCSAILPYASKLLGGAAKDGISVDAQLGDRENDVGTQLGGSTGTRDIKAKGNAQVNVTSESGATKVASADKVTIQNIPPWVFLVALIGWILPTPNSIYKGIKTKWQRLLHRQQ